MKQIINVVAKFVKFAFAGFVIIFIATLTYQFAQRVYPNAPLLQVMLLALFDIAAFVWFFTFMKAAEGTWQRAISGIMFLVSLVAIALVVAAETITGESAAMAGITVETLQAYATWAIVVLAFLNSAASYFFYLTHPNNLKAMQEQAHLERQREHEIRMAEFEMDMQENILKETEKAMANEARVMGGEIAATIGAREMQAFYARLGVKKNADGTFVLDAQWRDAPQARLSAASPSQAPTSTPPRFRHAPNPRKGNRAWNLPGFIKKALVTTMVCPSCQTEAVMSDLGHGQYECQNCQAVLALQGTPTAIPTPLPTPLNGNGNGNGHHADPTQAP